MRYYKIVITDPATGNIIQSPNSAVDPASTYTSYVNGQTLPGALNVEFDMLVAPYATPSGGAYLRVWGISLAEISRARDLNFKNIAVYAGMKKGLPLANPALSGLIVQGQIFQAFGNWIGTDMTLDLILQPAVGTPVAPANIVINWRAGTPLAQAITQTLGTAFPSLALEVDINAKLVLPNNEIGFWPTLEQFAAWVKQRTAAIAPVAGYQGVDISISGTALVVDDGTAQTTPKEIAYQDLIGQPTWIDSPLIQFKCPVRNDIRIGDLVKMPPSLVVNTSAAASSQINLKSAFEGIFQVAQVRQVGNYRQTAAEAWCTTVDAFPTQLVQ